MISQNLPTVLLSRVKTNNQNLLALLFFSDRFHESPDYVLAHGCLDDIFVSDFASFDVKICERRGWRMVFCC